MGKYFLDFLDLVGSIFVEVVKSPIVKKFAFIATFFSLMLFIIDYFLGTVQSNLQLEYFELLYYLGVIQAIQVLVSFAITTYVANHILTYLKTF